MTEKQTVLIVEDEEPIRRIIKTELEKSGLHVLEAENGREAIGIALTENPNLILLDVLMPKMHGIEMIEMLRKDSWGRTAKVILLTNYVDDPDVIAAVDKGYCEMLNKGQTRLPDIVQKVKDALAKK